jgi:hypothetical protein
VNQNLPTRRLTRAERAARVGVALAALAASKHYKLDDLTIEVYDRVLADLPVDFIEAVCRDFERTGEWMPKPAEIRAECKRRRRAMLKASVEAVAESRPGVHCHLCLDTGWQQAGESTVRRCPCRKDNPNFLARHL